MKVFDLRCEHDHVFEGWFGSEQDYHAQQERGLLQCPICGSAKVGKTLSAPHLKGKSNRGMHPTQQRDAAVIEGASMPAHASGAAGLTTGEKTDARGELLARWLAHARTVLQHGDNVGSQFASEARRIHGGEAPERLIHGQATPGEVVELLEEGIPVLPLPDAANEPLQ